VTRAQDRTVKSKETLQLHGTDSAFEGLSEFLLQGMDDRAASSDSQWKSARMLQHVCTAETTPRHVMPACRAASASLFADRTPLRCGADTVDAGLLQADPVFEVRAMRASCLQSRCNDTT